MKKIALLMLVFTAFIFTTAMGPNGHENYLRALSDLRTARWMLQHGPANYQLSKDEEMATTKIDEIISELKKASIDDGKSNNDSPKTSESNDRTTRLQKVMLWLDKAHADIQSEVEDTNTKELNAKATKDVMEARDAVKRALIAK